MSGRWFRFYDAVVDDPKVQRLPDFTFRGWVNVLCIASRNGGIIPADPADLAFSLRISTEEAGELLHRLLEARLIERVEAGYSPHNWPGRQDHSDSAAERMRRYRERNKERNALRDGDVLEQNREDSEQNKPDQHDDGAHGLLVRICEILRLKLEDDPNRCSWKRQIGEMLRDGLTESEIIAATETARVRGKLSLPYIRSVAFNAKPAPPHAAPTSGLSTNPAERALARLKASGAS